MRTGIGYPSYTSEAVWTAVSGAWSADYPLANVADMIRSSQVARATSNAQREFKAVLPASRIVQFFAFIGHNISSAAGAFRIYAFSDNNPDPVANAANIVADSGALLIWPSGAPVSGYRSIRPYVFSAPVLARSFYFAVSAIDVNLEIEAIEIAQWWEWPGISYGFETGVMATSDTRELIGAPVDETDDPGLRTMAGQIDYLKLGADVDAADDFQLGTGYQRPFVFVQDYETPASWPRTTVLARNKTVSPLVGAVYRADTFQFRFVEHRR